MLFYKKAAKSEIALNSISIFLNILLSLFIFICILLERGLLYNYIKKVLHNKVMRRGI